MLILKEVSKKFKNEKGIFNISFSFSMDKIVGLIGDNGAGKTTIIKTILGDYKKDSGEISLLGNSENYKKDITYFPDQNNFPKNSNIIDYCLYTQSLKGQNYKKDDPKILELVGILGLKDYLNSSFQKLSSGMQKRALLLSLILSKPKLIILDEPTENLDIKSRTEFLKLIEFISKEYKVGIMITSHNIDEIENIINYVIVVKSGKVVHVGDFDKTNSNLKELYFKSIGTENEVLDFERLREFKKNENNS
ncbi:ABC transporter ATP-binding protein [Spiroplasma sp. BIUS-1]|uniref:ATP-binding cassette domain-containing protein n=1 Tax=Spiroplasma sp. BIUS-1 TaxID=216964 RepID=UPI0013981A97|nr:ABC transporter ATP-binding protein [Spiroplasma sp. BIUS-1]QHX37083.1 ABC transporter ATP-binding protein [Spiroplasma sp. BIUS-1]